MNYLVLINYEGDFYQSGNLENLENTYKKYSGLKPYIILDQPSRENLLSFLNELKLESCEKLIIQIKSHGFEKGIANIYPQNPTTGVADTFISWDTLTESFNKISQNCQELFINLGIVCDSNHLLSSYPRNFQTLSTRKTVSNQTEPKKINKAFLEDRLDEFPIDENIYHLN